MKFRICLGVLFLAAPLWAQTTSFTYQGRLSDQGAPASGTYDLQFSLWNSSAGPAQLGGTLASPGLAISNGLFTVTLDFGSQFPGADRWLEITVKTNGAGAYSTLSPRQQITSSPYAISSLTAASAASVAAANITGTVGLEQLPAAVVTNGAGGVSLSGTFAGGGAGLTSLNAASLTGTMPASVLPTNTALRAGGNVFSGSQQVLDAVATGATALDQQLTNSNTGANQFVNPWQSFTAGTNGLLTAVTLMVRSPITGTPCPGFIRIYAGEGTNGPLLAAQAVTWQDAGFNVFQTNSIDAPPQLVTGAKYTVQASSPLIQNGWIYLDTAGNYPGGRSNIDPAWDYPFKTFMTPGATSQTVLMVNPAGFSGYVGIGTNAPQAKLHVAGNILASGTITGNGAGLTNVSASGGAGSFSGAFSGAFTGNGSGLTNLDAADLATGTVPEARLSGNVPLLNRPIQAFTGGTNSFSGNVGIGTTTPQSKLQVAGDIKLGGSGQYFAPAAEENLRIVRGSVSSAGALLNGAGFTCSRTANATFQVTFNTAFSSNPSVVVSCGAAGATVNSQDVATLTSASTTGFTVLIGVRNIGFFDEPFSFIAVGPR